MIQENDILLVGQTQKPHGIRGELVLVFREAAYSAVAADFYFLEMDGIPVPYFVEEFRSTSDVAARVKFQEIEDMESASRLVNKRVFLPRKLVEAAREDAGNDWNYFIGFEVMDQTGEHVGTVREVDDSTLNVLFVVVREEEEQLIPATEDFILAIDEEKGLIEMQLPEGLLER